MLDHFFLLMSYQFQVINRECVCTYQAQKLKVQAMTLHANSLIPVADVSEVHRVAIIKSTYRSKYLLVIPMY